MRIIYFVQSILWQYWNTYAGKAKCPYTDVAKAWISSGTAQNGTEEHYCNISLNNQTVIRIPFYYNDENSVDYFIQQANATVKSTRFTSNSENDEYLIDGKTLGKTRAILGIVMLVIFALLNYLIVKEAGFIFIVIPNIIMGIVIAWLMFNYYLFFQVKIKREGFYCRTTPFDGKYYKYNEIKNCRMVKKVVRHFRHGRGAIRRTYYFYFEFTDSTDKKHKFQFEPQLYEHEVRVLKERIEAAGL